jgi:hypothetical protein
VNALEGEKRIQYRIREDMNLFKTVSHFHENHIDR